MGNIRGASVSEFTLLNNLSFNVVNYNSKRNDYYIVKKNVLIPQRVCSVNQPLARSVYVKTKPNHQKRINVYKNMSTNIKS